MGIVGGGCFGEGGRSLEAGRYRSGWGRAQCSVWVFTRRVIQQLRNTELYRVTPNRHVDFRSQGEFHVLITAIPKPPISPTNPTIPPPPDCQLDGHDHRSLGAGSSSTALLPHVSTVLATSPATRPLLERVAHVPIPAPFARYLLPLEQGDSPVDAAAGASPESRR